jgi:hypothetical protein
MSKAQLFSTFLVVSSVLFVFGSRNMTESHAAFMLGGDLPPCTHYLNNLYCPETYLGPDCDEVPVQQRGAACFWWVDDIPTADDDCNAMKDKNGGSCGNMSTDVDGPTLCYGHYRCLPF